MKIQNTERSGTTNGGGTGVFIASNLVRVREMLDKNGNTINPRTKRIIKQAIETPTDLTNPTQ